MCDSANYSPGYLCQWVTYIFPLGSFSYLYLSESPSKWNSISETFWTKEHVSYFKRPSETSLEFFANLWNHSYCFHSIQIRQTFKNIISIFVKHIHANITSEFSPWIHIFLYSFPQTRFLIKIYIADSFFNSC